MAAAAIHHELAKAGIKSSVQVEDSQARGIALSVQIGDSSKHADASGIIGRFPFIFSIS